VLVFYLTDGRSPLPRSLGTRLAHRPHEGDLVRVVVAHADFWAPGGVLSVVADQVRLTGPGELLRPRSELFRRLDADGLTYPAEETPRFRA
jgi:exonuclease VII large subunit